MFYKMTKRNFQECDRRYRKALSYIREARDWKGQREYWELMGNNGMVQACIIQRTRALRLAEFWEAATADFPQVIQLAVYKAHHTK